MGWGPSAATTALPGGDVSGLAGGAVAVGGNDTNRRFTTLSRAPSAHRRCTRHGALSLTLTLTAQTPYAG